MKKKDMKQIDLFEREERQMPDNKKAAAGTAAIKKVGVMKTNEGIMPKKPADCQEGADVQIQPAKIQPKKGADVQIQPVEIQPAEIQPQKGADVQKDAPTMGADVLFSSRENSVLQMSSLEIAELVNSRHDNVKRTIERLASRATIEFPPMEEIQTATKPMQAYIFRGQQGKRDSLIVVAQLSPEFTAALVDRWQELEKRLAAPALPNFTDPAEAAIAWAEQYRKKQALEEKVKADAPKVEFYDAVIESDSTLDMSQVAKVLNMGMGGNKLFYFLRQQNILRENNEPYQRYVSAGWFKQVEYKFSSKGATKVGIKTVVLQKGLDAIRKMLIQAGCAVEVVK